MDKLANPAGLDGFAFLEFSSKKISQLESHFSAMGFCHVANHKSKSIKLFKQANIYFLLNDEANSQAQIHADTHGDGACAMGFKVNDANKAFEYTLSQGATAFNDSDKCSQSSLPAIQAIGGSIIYFVEDFEQLFSENYDYIHSSEGSLPPCHLVDIDHLTHNVRQGNMDKWADFYTQLFNFQQIRFFDIKGQKTGLISRAMGSPCGKIKIPLNEATDQKSQIEEFITEYHGEGIQHIALNSDDIYQSVSQLKTNGIDFLDVPDTYYEMISDRIDWHSEDLNALQQRKILIDGEKEAAGGLLLQIFTQNMLGPAFFEIIQRKGNEGFGEGNFQALFESIERDQMRRGTL